MYKYLFIALWILANLSCQNQKAQKAVNYAENKVDSMSNSFVNSKDSEKDDDIGKIVETFSDESKVGVPHKNKIELSMIKGSLDNSVELKFYSLNKDQTWKLKQTIRQIKYGSLSCDLQIKDFNNDGFKDVTFVSSIAARGANVIRNLLIYDNKNDELIFIKNSGDYPNLLYNKKLNCIDSQAITGSSSTSFLKIDGDILKEFARVETSNTSNTRTVYLIDKNGKERFLQTDKIQQNELFERYKTFNPPTINTDEEIEQ